MYISCTASLSANTKVFSCLYHLSNQQLILKTILSCGETLSFCSMLFYWSWGGFHVLLQIDQIDFSIFSEAIDWIFKWQEKGSLGFIQQPFLQRNVFLKPTYAVLQKILYSPVQALQLDVQNTFKKILETKLVNEAHCLFCLPLTCDHVSQPQQSR